VVRPSPTYRYFRPRGWSRLRLFPWHRRQGSYVPHQSLIELRAAYTPDAARSVSGHPPSLSRRTGHPAVLTSPNQLSTLQKQFACARLSRSCLPRSSSRRFRDAHDHGFWPQPFAVAWDQRPDRRTRRALLHLQYSCASPCGPATLVTQEPLLTCLSRAAPTPRIKESRKRSRPLHAAGGDDRTASPQSPKPALRHGRLKTAGGGRFSCHGELAR
jgi:hypothetical protein